ncbi:hypothetical protein D3C79_923900 [compost metagenome]
MPDCSSDIPPVPAPPNRPPITIASTVLGSVHLNLSPNASVEILFWSPSWTPSVNAPPAVVAPNCPIRPIPKRESPLVSGVIASVNSSALVPPVKAKFFLNVSSAAAFAFSSLIPRFLASS